MLSEAGRRAKASLPARSKHPYFKTALSDRNSFARALPLRHIRTPVMSHLAAIVAWQPCPLFSPSSHLRVPSFPPHALECSFAGARMSSPGVSGAEVWKTWEGRVVDGKFPLRRWIGGSG